MRLVGWCRRHPRWSGLFGVLLVLIVVAAATGNGDGPDKARHGRSVADDVPLTSASSPASTTPTTHPAMSAPAGPSTRKGGGQPAARTSPGSTAARISTAPADRDTGASALTMLAGLRVKGRAPQTGYARSWFGPAWTDDNDDPGGHNGCDTRNDVLRRDLTGTAIKDGTRGCVVLTGTLHDPYTGHAIAFTRGAETSTAVQIDHVVALDDAWQTGAQQFSPAKRVDLANDPLNLLAVDGPANESKGAGDAATWLPPNKAYRCAYVARQVAVKSRYGLWVTAAERDAIAGVLSSCPGQAAPVEGGAPPAAAPVANRSSAKSAVRSSVATSPKSAPHFTHTTAAAPVVTTFANCTQLRETYPHGVGLPGAHDLTSGTPDTQFKVSAALYNANAGSDRDKDAIACEA